MMRQFSDRLAEYDALNIDERLRRLEKKSEGGGKKENP